MHLKGNNLLESIISLSLLNVLNMVLPLVTLPYIVKVVGIANYGAYSIAYAIVQYILLVSTYGFNFSVTKQIAQCRDNRQHINDSRNIQDSSYKTVILVGNRQKIQKFLDQAFI